VVLMVAFSLAYRLVMASGAGVQWADELGRLIVSGVVLGCLLLAFDRLDEGLLYKVCPSLMVAGLLACMLDTLGVAGFSGASGVGDLLVGAGYSGLTLYVYLTLNAICFRFGTSSTWLFGMTRAACLAVDVARCAADVALMDAGVSVGLAGAGSSDAGVSAAVTCAVVVAIVLLSMGLMSRRTAVTSWGARPSARRASSAEGAGAAGEPAGVGGGTGEGPAGGATAADAGQGGAYLEDQVYRCAMVARHFGLTHREEEVLSLICQGTPFQEIENVLSIAHSTLKVHAQHIYAKLGVHSREEARRVVEGWRS
jgi:DNA-binding CsgD family transcriptional regulator